MATESKDEDRLFVRDGFRHYRRTYSLGEVRWGAIVFALLLVLSGWVIWKGRHPDPALYSDGASLLAPGETKVPIAQAGTATAPLAGRGESQVGTAVAGRGPLPDDLAGSDWTEDKIASFDEENLYVKINGRADYFRAFGFKQMTSVLLNKKGDPTTTIDVEMYDLARAPNALGAYGGERPQDAKVIETAGGLHHFDRNALFMARGPYYIRILGSDETPVITAKLKSLADVMLASVAAAPLPWVYPIVLGELGLSADRMTYFAKNAFSLAFADDVWSVRPLGKDKDLEWFLSARKDVRAAKRFSAQLHTAFLEMGERAGKKQGVDLVKDQFLGLFSAAAIEDRFVIGVRGADSGAAAVTEIGKLRAALRAAPAEVRARAAPLDQAASQATPPEVRPVSPPQGAPTGSPPSQPAQETGQKAGVDER